MNFSMNLLTAVATSADTLASDLAELPPLPALTLVAVMVIAILYAYISKAIRSRKGAAATKENTAVEKEAPVSTPMPAGATQGELELIGTDEKTAAVIMAIVSNKSGIPLNRLSFKSIKLMEDK